MNNDTKHERPTGPDLHTALSSPMRLEMIGLFTDPGPLSISDMATRLGRPATSLYHHVEVLENAGVLRRAGTRPKGKRFETLFELTGNSLELDLDPDDPQITRQIGQTMTAALRMAERDFLAALQRDDVCTDGPGRNLIGLRGHLRIPPEQLPRFNEHLQAIVDLLHEHGTEDVQPGPDDQFLSLTLMLAPLRGRRATDPGDQS